MRLRADIQFTFAASVLLLATAVLLYHRTALVSHAIAATLLLLTLIISVPDKQPWERLDDAGGDDETANAKRPQVEDRDVAINGSLFLSNAYESTYTPEKATSARDRCEQAQKPRVAAAPLSIPSTIPSQTPQCFIRRRVTPGSLACP